MSGPPVGTAPEIDLPGPPAHGYRGDSPVGTDRGHPRGLTVAISREAGARGTTIARKLGELLGWQVYDQELLDYLLLDETGRAQLLADVPDAARSWADGHLGWLQRGRRVSSDPATDDLFRLVLAVAARGEAIVVGRGAGFLLPVETTLHARIVASMESRVNYLAQAFRLTRQEAADEVRNRDDRRRKFLLGTILRDPSEPDCYDVIVNSTRLGIEGTAQFLASAVRTKQRFAETGESGGPPEFDDHLE